MLYVIVCTKTEFRNAITKKWQYRVVSCYASWWSVKSRNRVYFVDGLIPNQVFFAFRSDVPKKIGTLINPRHELFGKPKRMR